MSPESQLKASVPSRKGTPVNRLFASLLLAFSVVAFAQAPHLNSGATVYIEPIDGYETYLAAAFAKKQVPLIAVVDKDKADYIIKVTVIQKNPSKPAVVVNNTVNNGNNDSGGGGFFGGLASGIAKGSEESASHGSTSVSISVIDPRSSQIVFAYSSGAYVNVSQLQRAAEASAKHLKQFIEKPKK